MKAPWVTVPDFNTQKILKRFKLFQKQTTALTFSPDEKWLAAGGQGESIRGFEQPDYNLAYKIEKVLEFYVFIGFFTERRMVGFNRVRGKFTVLETGSWNLIGEIQLEMQRVQALAFSPKGS